MLTADHDSERHPSDIFTFVGHEIEEEAISDELLSGSIVERFDDFLNSKRSYLDVRPTPSASAPTLTDMDPEAELRYVCTDK